MKKTKIGVRKPFTTMNKMEGKLRKIFFLTEKGSQCVENIFLFRKKVTIDNLVFSLKIHHGKIKKSILLL